MPTRRQARINALLLEELSLSVSGRSSDPRLSEASITRVESTQDLGTAKVYFTVSPALDDEEADAVASALAHAQGHLRAGLAGLGLRRIPRLVFARDRAFESGRNVIDILNRLDRERSADESSGAAADGEL